MPTAAPTNGTARRQAIAVHARLQIEAQAKVAGLTITKWRDGKPVVRIPAGSKS